AAVVDAAPGIGLASIAELVGVAIRPARVAQAGAPPARTDRGRDVIVRAQRAARAAIGGIGRGVGLAAVRLLVAVAVGPARVASAGALAVGARRHRDVIVGAERAAATTIGGIGRGVDFAAVGLLVVVTVRPARRAGAVAGAVGAGRGDVAE